MEHHQRTIIFIQKKAKGRISYSRSQAAYLNFHFEKELQIYYEELFRAQRNNRMKLIKQVEEFDFERAFKLLELYLYMCKLKYRLAFWQSMRFSKFMQSHWLVETFNEDIARLQDR